MSSFRSNENIRKQEGGSDYVVLASKASSLMLIRFLKLHNSSSKVLEIDLISDNIIRKNL